MEQRRLRLGDILDDYCPRERRVTNHVVVAMIEDDVKQTRCSTCDADHEYKQAKVPAPRRRKEAGALVGEAAEAPRARRPEPAETIEVADEADDASMLEVDIETSELVTEALEPLDAEPVAPHEREDDGPVHRRLIRATLPRPEGQVPERKETEFTVRQQGGGGGGRGREIDGNRPQGGHRRPQRGSDRQGDMRFGGAPPGNHPRGGGGGGGSDSRGNRSGGPPRQGQPGGGGQPGGQRPDRPGGENRFRRRRGR